MNLVKTKYRTILNDETLENTPTVETWTLDTPTVETWTLDTPTVETWTLDTPTVETWTLDTPTVDVDPRHSDSRRGP